MLNLIIFSLCIAAIKAAGEFTVLNVPKALSFKGNEPIPSQAIPEVLTVSLGYSISGESKWSVLYVHNPFALPKRAVVVSVNGVGHSNISTAGNTYIVEGNIAEQSLNIVTDTLKADNKKTCVFNFKQLEEAKLSIRNIIGNVDIPSVSNAKHLNSQIHTDDRNFLESCALTNALADNFIKIQHSCDYLHVSFFIDGIIQTHGEDSAAVNEAINFMSAAINNLKIADQKLSKNEDLIVVVVNKPEANSRSKRDIAPDNAKSLYNLAEYYNQDYPVIFNIILWFMVVFGFALLAICYAIGSMDPGRDSIIYRMTSTRMKKDN